MKTEDILKIILDAGYEGSINLQYDSISFWAPKKTDAIPVSKLRELKEKSVDENMKDYIDIILALWEDESE